MILINNLNIHHTNGPTGVQKVGTRIAFERRGLRKCLVLEHAGLPASVPIIVIIGRNGPLDYASREGNARRFGSNSSGLLVTKLH